MAKQVIELRVGMLGWSAETITQDQDGYCHFPVGEKDPTYAGGRKWVKLRVNAKEDIRQEYEVIISNEELQVKEHTPVELAYQSRAGPYQRVTEDFPLPVVQSFQTAQATTGQVTEGQPLPVTAGSRAIIHITVVATALGNTPILAAPGSGFKIRVHYFSYSNLHAAFADVAMRFTATGGLRHRHGLAAQGGNIPANLIDCNWEGGDNQALFANLAAAYAGGIVFNVGYTIEAV